MKFQSPQRRGMGSDGKMNEHQIIGLTVSIPSKAGHGFGRARGYAASTGAVVSIPSKAGHGFGRHVPDPPVGASRRSVERVLG